MYKLVCLRKTRPVTGADEKQALHRYLRNVRGVLVWKLEDCPTTISGGR